MVFGNGVKNIQAVAYNGARTVYGSSNFFLFAGNVTTGVTILKMNVPFARWELMPWENT